MADGSTATSDPLSGSNRHRSAGAEAGRPGSGGVAHRTPVDLLTTRPRTAPLGLLCALAALVTWLIIAPRTPDLAAAAYRLDLFKHAGFALYDEHWYGGHELPGYSLLFPPLAWLLGLRLLAGGAALVSVACFERLVVPRYGAAGRWASVAFALAAVGDVWIGRLTFALGVAFALAAVLAYAGGRAGGAAGPVRLLGAGVLAACSAAASPVAGVLLALAALTESLSKRSPRALLVLGAPAALVALALSALFGEGGFEPFPILSFGVTVAVVAAFALALPRDARRLRLGAGVYLLACLAFLLLRTPMGSNVQRYGVLLAGPLLICSLGAARARRAPALLAALALVLWAVWAAWGPVRETLAVAGSPATNGAFYAPVERYLAAHTSGPVRLEVPLTRSHWEAAELAPRVSLARGWEKQLDERYDAPLLSPRLNASEYERWLRQEAIAYVALPDVQLDPSSAREGALVRAGLPYLRLVHSTPHWRIYAVRDPTPLLSGRGRLLSLGHDSFAVRAEAPGSLLLRVRYTRWFALRSGAGCVGRGAGGWTRLDAARAGVLRVHATFSLSRALGAGGSCAP